MKIHAIEIDEKIGSAYVYLEPPRPSSSVRQVNISNAIILDIGKNGNILGIEILHPVITKMLMTTDSRAELKKAHIPVKNIG